MFGIPDPGKMMDIKGKHSNYWDCLVYSMVATWLEVNFQHTFAKVRHVIGKIPRKVMWVGSVQRNLKMENVSTLNVNKYDQNYLLSRVLTEAKGAKR